MDNPESAKTYTELTSEERISELRGELGHNKLNNRFSTEVQFDKGQPTYLWVRSIKDKGGIGPPPKRDLISNAGEIHEDDIKLHLNVSAEKLLEVVKILSDLQDELAEVEKEGLLPGTFQFKVAVADRPFNTDTNKPPPRIVIYPSSYGLYGGIGEDFVDKNFTGEYFLKGLIELINERLGDPKDWASDTFRARYHKKLYEYSNTDGSIEAVRGSTLEQGDNSRR